ncbi:MAG: hypothetical protein AABX47_08310 [Nanoarchaeota archaeon]
MDPIRIAALIIGLIGLLKGALGLASPSRLVGWTREHVLRRDNHHLQFYGFGSTVIGGFLIYMIWEEVQWIPTLTVLIATMVLLKGIMTLFFPEVTRASIRAMAAIPKTALRAISLIAIILAAYLIAFGTGFW